MKCINCLEEIPDGSVFCNLCGAKQDENQIEAQIDQVNQKLDITEHSFSAHGRLDCKKWIKEFGFDEVCEAVDISLNQYLHFDSTEKPTEESVIVVFDKIPGICFNRKMAKQKPYAADALKMLAYAKKKFYLSDRQELEYKNHLERLLYLFSQKAKDYNAMYEDVFWKLKKATDKWEYLDELKELIEVWEVPD